MPAPNPLSTRRLPDPVRRRLEVSTAMSWEALVEAHIEQADQFVDLLSGRLGFAEAVDRYLREMRVPDAMAPSVRTRVLVSLEDTAASVDEDDFADVPATRSPGWRRFRPAVLVRGVQERMKRGDETEGWIKLALARAEEAIILAHVDNALSFAALLGPYQPLDRAVMEYIDAIELVGGRAQVVHQRTMARLADVHLPAMGSLDDVPDAPLGSG